MKEFIIGGVYNHPGLYGPSWYVRITSRTETTITFEEINFPGQDLQTRDIIIDTDGTEMIEAWEYRDHKGYMFAK